MNHIVELVLPWGLLLGRRSRCVSGLAQVRSSFFLFVQSIAAVDFDSLFFVRCGMRCIVRFRAGFCIVYACVFFAGYSVYVYAVCL